MDLNKVRITTKGDIKIPISKENKKFLKDEKIDPELLIIEAIKDIRKQKKFLKESEPERKVIEPKKMEKLLKDIEKNKLLPKGVKVKTKGKPKLTTK